jgi:hypothetical protein
MKKADFVIQSPICSCRSQIEGAVVPSEFGLENLVPGRRLAIHRSNPRPHPIIGATIHTLPTVAMSKGFVAGEPPFIAMRAKRTPEAPPAITDAANPKRVVHPARTAT